MKGGKVVSIGLLLVVAKGKKKTKKQIFLFTKNASSFPFLCLFVCLFVCFLCVLCSAVQCSAVHTKEKEKEGGGWCGWGCEVV